MKTTDMMVIEALIAEHGKEAALAMVYDFLAIPARCKADKDFHRGLKQALETIA